MKMYIYRDPHNELQIEELYKQWETTNKVPNYIMKCKLFPTDWYSTMFMDELLVCRPLKTDSSQKDKKYIPFELVLYTNGYISKTNHIHFRQCMEW